MPSEKEIEAAEKVRWQPIETAPKDGTAFLACTKDIGYYIVHWCGNHNNFACEWDCTLVKPDCTLVKPDYWYPLPLSPEEQDIELLKTRTSTALDYNVPTDEFLAKQSQADILFDALQMMLERFNFSNENEPCVRMATKVRNDYLDRKQKSDALMQMMTGIASDEDFAEAQERHSKCIDENIDVYKRLADR